ncbi:MAG: type III-A CRISPR-associated protein Cas10/Csm1 [Chloroflexi bacterium]|nr:type III-A CRISPR-associated protein Cas10/Csm1 [Chloroflexota bacterium]
MDQTEFHTVVLAGLLHDISKLLHRSRDFEIKGPHPQVSAEFVGAFAGTFGQAVDVELLKTLVLRHHRGQGFVNLRADDIGDPRQRLLAFLVNKADGLSASERGQHAAQWQDYKTTPLACVFQRVFPAQHQSYDLRYHPSALTSPEEMGKGHFPDIFRDYAPGELEVALRQFGDQARPLLRALAPSFDVQFSHLLALLATHTWAIPADTQEEVPDVSLYDHLRTTAAIAACLYRYYEAHNTWDEAALPDPPGEPFCLAVGDVSGIQEYIFHIASAGGGTAKRLRARSLFVQTISEAAPLHILRKFGLPPANVLMASGGKFYVLLPNTEDTKKKLEAIQRHVDQWSLTGLRGALALNLAWVAFGEAGFRRFGQVMAQSMDRLAERKDRRFRQALLVNSAWDKDVFVFPPFGADQRACPSCDSFPVPKDGETLCLQCGVDREWGERLHHQHYVIISPGASGADREMAGVGVSLRAGLAELSDKQATLIRLNNPDTLEAAQYPTSYRYLLTRLPTDNGEVLDFKKIAAKSAGRHYLGFLKADVDRLGEVFAFGLKRETPEASLDTVSQLATLSRQLDLFFTGWVQHLLCKDFPDCYPVFSGGDDLFLVGPWDRVLEMAGRIHDDFARWTGNPRLTISAGVVVGPDSYPIGQAADDAEHAVDEAKDKGRDRITLLGHTLTWRDWNTISADWQKLQREDTTSAFLYSLLEYGRMWRDYHQNGNVLGLRFQPMLAYNLGRNVDPRKTPALHQWAKGLVDYRPVEKEKELVLDNLGLLAQLLVLCKGGKA